MLKLVPTSELHPESMRGQAAEICAALESLERRFVRECEAIADRRGSTSEAYRRAETPSQQTLGRIAALDNRLVETRAKTPVELASKARRIAFKIWEMGPPDSEYDMVERMVLSLVRDASLLAYRDVADINEHVPAQRGPAAY